MNRWNGISRKQEYSFLEWQPCMNVKGLFKFDDKLLNWFEYCMLVLKFKWLSNE